jgi:hypothetical protein
MQTISVRRQIERKLDALPLEEQKRVLCPFGKCA